MEALLLAIQHTDSFTEIRSRVYPRHFRIKLLTKQAKVGNRASCENDLHFTPKREKKSCQSFKET